MLLTAVVKNMCPILTKNLLSFFTMVTPFGKQPHTFFQPDIVHIV